MSRSFPHFGKIKIEERGKPHAKNQDLGRTYDL